ncbi:MAG TPA: type IV toxin-antitoxin system AbiEi family antitoxin domain-containing protein [Tepidiformaceae bacterium]|nr:type IV toxin-antitoxin system AbiEi family antitoxin domain-containing protein [Tepidiformaceae bacterium]
MPSTRSESGLVRRARAIFRRHGGLLRMADAVRAGVHRRTLYAMRDSGEVEALARGLYRLADSTPLGHADLVTVAAKAPRGVVCLISALAFHEMTTQVPHEVWIAVSRNSEPPRLDYPPLRVVRMSPASYEAGIETHRLDGSISRARRWPQRSGRRSSIVGRRWYGFPPH